VNHRWMLYLLHTHSVIGGGSRKRHPRQHGSEQCRYRGVPRSYVRRRTEHSSHEGDNLTGSSSAHRQGPRGRG
jgi:hypothetical protein